MSRRFDNYVLEVAPVEDMGAKEMQQHRDSIGLHPLRNVAQEDSPMGR
jgi:hypothetical protein